MDEHLNARLDNIETRLGSIEEHIRTINEELGVLCGRVNNNTKAMLIKYVVFPLILITGGLAGVKIFLPLF